LRCVLQDYAPDLAFRQLNGSPIALYVTRNKLLYGDRWPCIYSHWLCPFNLPTRLSWRK